MPNPVKQYTPADIEAAHQVALADLARRIPDAETRAPFERAAKRAARKLTLQPELLLSFDPLLKRATFASESCPELTHTAQLGLCACRAWYEGRVCFHRAALYILLFLSLGDALVSLPAPCPRCDNVGCDCEALILAELSKPPRKRQPVDEATKQAALTESRRQCWGCNAPLTAEQVMQAGLCSTCNPEGARYAAVLYRQPETVRIAEGPRGSRAEAEVEAAELFA